MNGMDLRAEIDELHKIWCGMRISQDSEVTKMARKLHDVGQRLVAMHNARELDVLGVS